MTHNSNVKDEFTKNEIAIIFLSFVLFTIVFYFQMRSTTGISNSDNVMRLINLRDLLAGHSWFDPHQYRLGLDAGTVMHWSRLIDLPILLIYKATFFAIGNQQTSEFAVMILWPLMMFAISLLGLAHICKRLAMGTMLGPICIIGTMCLYSIGVYSFGDLDHHNAQIALAIWIFALMAIPNEDEKASQKPAFISGILAVLMLAIGMEALPYVVAFGSWVAISFMFGKWSPKVTRAFGLGFSSSAVIIFVATIDPRAYLTASCDSYSVFHLVLCSIGGLGLFACSQYSSSLRARLIGLAITALFSAAAVVLLFPECLTNPLSNLDPNLRKFWLDGVIETRSIVDLWSSDPFQLFGIFGMGTVGLIASLILLKHSQANIRWTATLWALSLTVALIVTAWQQRGNIFAASFAIFPLAFILTEARNKYLKSENTSDLLKMVAIAIPSLNLFWWAFGSYAAGFLSAQPTLQQQAASVSQEDYCYADSVFSVLANEPKGVVLGATDIGVPILKLTDHRVLAAPYHRNTNGNLAMINAMIAEPAKAKEIIQTANVTLIADCKNSADAYDFKLAHPEGLQAMLHKGIIPDWLEAVEATTNTPLVLYRVKR